jgi:hypothetical protein
MAMDFATGATDPDHASPHGLEPLTAGIVAMPLALERFGAAVLPAGGTTWASADDLGAYLALQQRRGTGPDGRRVVSEAAVLETWIPHTPTGDGSDFGLGWIVGPDYEGLRQLSYSGGNLGFSSHVSFLPEADLGVAILTNAPIAVAFLKSVPAYVYETAFGLEHAADADHAAEGSMIQGLLLDMASQVEPGGDSAAFAAITGRYGADTVVRLDAQRRPQLHTIFGDVLLYPVTGQEGSYSVQYLLGAIATFAPGPDGSMAMTVTFAFGDPQPPATLRRGE